MWQSRLCPTDNTLYLRLCRWWSIRMLDKQLALLDPLRYHGAAAHGHDTHVMSWRTLLGKRSLQSLQENNNMTVIKNMHGKGNTQPGPTWCDNERTYERLRINQTLHLMLYILQSCRIIIHKKMWWWVFVSVVQVLFWLVVGGKNKYA